MDFPCRLARSPYTVAWRDMKTYYGFLILLLLPILLLPISSAKSDEVCISQGGRFPPFTSEGKPPKRVGKGSKDLTLCRVFSRKTCCDVSQTYPVLLAIRRLASSGEASQECLQLWELLECSVCDPQIGVQKGPPLICASFCDRVFQACADGYFSMDAKAQVLAPCGMNDFVCGRASEWVSNGTDLCKAAGYTIKLIDSDTEETSCYGSKASLDSIANSWRKSEVSRRASKGEVLKDFERWAEEMLFWERVCWAVGGMVLTAGLLFVSKRTTRNQCQKLAAIQQTVRRLEGNNQNSPTNQVNREGVRR